MAGQLPQPFVDGVEFVNAGIGSLRADINWIGAANSIDLDQMRTRWIARTNGASSPAPARTTAGGWAERTTLGTQGEFQYLDTVQSATTAQMAVAGAQSEENEAVVNSFFANKTVWVMARLEVA